VRVGAAGVIESTFGRGSGAMPDTIERLR